MVRNHMSLHDLCSGMKMFLAFWLTCVTIAGSGDPLEMKGESGNGGR